MRLLHVISECPYPANNGGRADTWARVEAMADLGWQIDMLIMSPDGQISPSAMRSLSSRVNRLGVLPQRSTRSCVAALAPARVSRNARLSNVTINDAYDMILLEAEDTIPILRNPALRSAYCVLRVHNNESNYMAELARAEEHFLRRQFFRLESWKFASFSRVAFGRADALWFISIKERDQFVRANPHRSDCAIWLPPGLLGTVRTRPRPNESKDVLFIGSLDIPLNREALTWYLNRVHPVLTRDPMYSLVIAGSTQGRAAAVHFASGLTAVPRCRVHLDREDLSDLYDSCALFINPMRRGGGVKLKTIHAVAHGIPVVSTSVGIEGSGLANSVHVKVADTEVGFASAVSQLLAEPATATALARNATQFLVTQYDTKSNLKRALSASEHAERSFSNLTWIS